MLQIRLATLTCHSAIFLFQTSCPLCHGFFCLSFFLILSLDNCTCSGDNIPDEGRVCTTHLWVITAMHAHPCPCLLTTTHARFCLFLVWLSLVCCSVSLLLHTGVSFSVPVSCYRSRQKNLITVHELRGSWEDPDVCLLLGDSSFQHMAYPAVYCGRSLPFPSVDEFLTYATCTWIQSISRSCPWKLDVRFITSGRAYHISYSVNSTRSSQGKDGRSASKPLCPVLYLFPLTLYCLSRCIIHHRQVYCIYSAIVLLQISRPSIECQFVCWVSKPWWKTVQNFLTPFFSASLSISISDCHNPFPFVLFSHSCQNTTIASFWCLW